jgi:hypothetical protein
VHVTENDTRMIRDGLQHLGPTLSKEWGSEDRGLIGKIAKVPLCAICPAAQWYRSERASTAELECFCTQFRGVMYNGVKTITDCDARDDFIKGLAPTDNTGG